MEDMLLCTPSVGVAEYVWSVRDLDLGSMISFSTMVTRFDNTNTSSICRRFVYPIYGFGGSLLYYRGEV
jgi:hypothetical protein